MKFLTTISEISLLLLALMPSMALADENSAIGIAAYNGHLSGTLALLGQCHFGTPEQQEFLNKEWKRSLDKMSALAGTDAAARAQMFSESQNIANSIVQMPCETDGKSEYFSTLTNSEIMATHSDPDENPNSDARLYATYALGSSIDEKCQILTASERSSLFRAHLYYFKNIYIMASESERETLRKVDNGFSPSSAPQCDEPAKARIRHATEVLQSDRSVK